MRVSVFVLAASLTIAGGVARPAGQQTPAPAQQTTFRSAVTLVTVDVSVLDSEGKPVPGLTAQDFEIKLNGRVRPVKVVTFVQAAGELSASKPPVVPAQPRPDDGVRQGRQTVDNDGVIAAVKQAGEDRVFVVLIDDLSFAPLRGKALFLAARKFIDGLPAMDLVGLATTSGAVSVNPTADRKRIQGVLARAGGEASDPQTLTPIGSDENDADGSVGISQSIDIAAGDVDVLKKAIADSCYSGDRTQIDKQMIDVLIAQNLCASQVQRQARSIAARTQQTTRRQVGSYVAVLEAMQAAAGLKHLVVLSDGLAIGRDADQLKPVAKAAATAGVQVTVLMEERDDIFLGDSARRDGRPRAGATGSPDSGAPQRRREDNRMFLAGGQLAAEMAGGQFHRIIGQPDPFFVRVRTASAAVYRLGIEPLPDVDAARIASVEAKVNRRGVLVHANRHGVAPASSALAAAEPTVEDRLKAAVGQGQSHGAVPLRVATSVRRTAGAQTLDLHVNAAVPASARGPLTAMFGLTRVPAPGEPFAAMTSGRGTMPAAAFGSFHWSVSVPAAPGSYLLRVAVADATGALGALEVPVELELSAMGPLMASDIVTAWVDSGGKPHVMALDELPSAATSLQVLFELYAPPGVLDALKDDVQVEVTVTRVGEKEPLDSRDVAPRIADGTLRTQVEFATADWRPGTYHVRARVRTGGQVAGTALSVVKVSAR